MNPLTALLTGSLVLGLVVFLFWPERGAFWKLQQRLQLTERVLLEDALKYLQKCERHQNQATIESMAGALSISVDEVSELIGKAQTRGLVRMKGNTFELTEPGRETAVQIIRAHRLWEKYLADATGYGEEEWHQRADRLEHLLTEEELEQLSARLGNPTHDPHGDPIPTSDGEIVTHGGIPITDLEEGAPARIVHIEDEPDVVYAQLMAEDIHLGQTIVVEEKTPDRIRFWENEKEHILAPIVARNISVVQIKSKPESIGDKGMSLDELKTGQRAKVLAISPRSRGVERRRLLDLGVIPGTEIEVDLVSPGGNPTAYRIRGSVIALRDSQAEKIIILPLAAENLLTVDQEEHNDN
jgi:DtxR family Mn-dependent transcriptional regulator